MVFQFCFKKMNSSAALKTLSQKKLSDVIERFLGHEGTVRVTFSTEKSEQRIHCYFQGWNGTVVNASGSSENMYASIDLVAQKLEAQLARSKMRSRRRLRLVDSTWNIKNLSERKLVPFSHDEEDFERAESYSYQLLH